MRVPIRKSDKYTHIKPDPYMTQAKFDELRSKMEKLIKIDRPREAAEVKRLALMGDFSENAAYQIAKGRLRGINQRIIDIENQLKTAEIIGQNKGGDYVSIGSFVTLERDGREKTYQILGSAETDPAAGIISHSSPLGSALLGKKIGDVIAIKDNHYRIIKIS